MHYSVCRCVYIVFCLLYSFCCSRKTATSSQWVSVCVCVWMRACMGEWVYYYIYMFGSAHILSLHTHTMYSWEQRIDPQGRIYYLDHNTRTTSWDRPEILPQGLVNSVDIVN